MGFQSYLLVADGSGSFYIYSHYVLLVNRDRLDGIVVVEINGYVCPFYYFNTFLQRLSNFHGDLWNLFRDQLQLWFVVIGQVDLVLRSIPC